MVADDQFDLAVAQQIFFGIGQQIVKTVGGFGNHHRHILRFAGVVDGKVQFQFIGKFLKLRFDGGTGQFRRKFHGGTHIVKFFQHIGILTALHDIQIHSGKKSGDPGDQTFAVGGGNEKNSSSHNNFLQSIIVIKPFK